MENDGSGDGSVKTTQAIPKHHKPTMHEKVHIWDHLKQPKIKGHVQRTHADQWSGLSFNYTGRRWATINNNNTENLRTAFVFFFKLTQVIIKIFWAPKAAKTRNWKRCNCRKTPVIKEQQLSEPHLTVTITHNDDRTDWVKRPQEGKSG